MAKNIIIDFDKVYDTNTSGQFKIIEDLGSQTTDYGTYTSTKRMIKVKFLKTGYEKVVTLVAANNGQITDPYYPTVFGIGYWGDIAKGSVYKREYDLWFTMLDRCYNTASPSYSSHGARGVRVHERWFCLANFINDIHYLPNYTNWYGDTQGKWQFDKDFLQAGIPANQRIYAPGTCMFLDSETNARLGGGISSKQYEAEKFSSKYYGLYKTPYNTYQCCVTIHGHKYFLGTYKDEIAAANVYNFVASRCIPDANLNNVPYMNINKALKFNSSRKPIQFPEGINLNTPINTTSQYVGVCLTQSGSYQSFYHMNGDRINAGRYTDEIAAANAHNWYESLFGNGRSINNVPYMSPVEWLQYKTRPNGKQMVSMCHIIQKGE